MNRRLGAPLALAAAVACSTAPEPPRAPVAPAPADLVLTGGRIVTMDPSRPEATALAARDGRIVAVGSDAEIAPYAGPATRVIELGGRLATPGLAEGHAHFFGIGRAAMILKLAPYRSWEEIVAAVGDAAAKAKPGEWILGRGWHQEKWDAAPEPAVEGFPVHDALSRVSPDNPVLLVHASGHAAFVNAAALAAAGIDERTADPPGGQILRDAAGRPTGLLREEAEGLVRAAYERAQASRPADEIAAEARHALELADREVLSKGITSFHDAGETFAELAAITRYAESGDLGTRLWVMVGGEPTETLAAGLDAARRVGAFDGKLTVRAIKAYMDGALGSRGAWLLRPYADQPESTGLAVTPIETLREIARLALAHDYQLCVHAIGDRANRETLDLFAAALATVPDGAARRWRIEHAQHLSPADIPRFARLGVVPAMQGIHCTSDAPFVVERLGEERARQGAYAWRSLTDAGARIVNGTDAPVEDVDPIASFYATVTRRVADGSRFYPGQALSRWEALASYTVNPAWAAFEENEKGTLAPGKLADVTVLSKDILKVPEDEIRDARAVYTIVGGRVLYEAPAEGGAR